MNALYDPEKFGLEIVAEADYADSYQFDMFVVWRVRETGKLIYGTDSGCSCPTPFEGFNVAEAKEIESLAPFEEWLQRGVSYGPAHYAAPEDIESFKKTVQAAVDEMMAKRKGA